MLLWRPSPVVAETAASQHAQQAPLGRPVFAPVFFLSALLRLWLLSHWIPSLYRVLLESESVAVAVASWPAAL